MKLEYRKTWKATEAEFFQKFLVFGNRGQKVKFGPKFGFFENILRMLHIVASFPKTHLGVAQGSKGEILPKNQDIRK